MKKKTLLLSILSIIMCLSLTVGGTFALFTSKSEVNVAVTSGTVNVTATVKDLQYKTLTKDWTAFEDGSKTTVFDNINGLATVDGQNVTLERIVPGDGLSFKIDVTNNSNVKVKYRTVITSSDDTDSALFNALEITVDEVKFNGAYATNWAELEASTNGEVVETISVKVELPKTAGEEQSAELMGKTCKFTVLVQAIQGNAATQNLSASVGVDGQASASANLKTNGADSPVVEVSKDILNDISSKVNDVESIALKHSEPKYDATTKTVTIDTFEIVDQDGNEIDFEAIGNDKEFIVTLPAEPALANVKGIYIYHDGEHIATVDADANGVISYKTTHFCEVVASKAVLSDKMLVNSFEELSKFFADATNDMTFVLTDNFTFTKKVDINAGSHKNKNFTIDLNGFDINAEITADYLFQVYDKSGASLTLTSSKEGSEINVGNKALVLAYGNVNVSNVTINAGEINSSSNQTFKMSGADLTINNATINVKHLGTSLINSNKNVTISGSDINIGLFKTNGGEFISNNASTMTSINDSSLAMVLGKTSFGQAFVYGYADNVTINEFNTIITDEENIYYELAKVDGNVRFQKAGYAVSTAEQLKDALSSNNGEEIFFLNDISVVASEGGYNQAGIIVSEEDILNGNGFTLTVTGANGTWDCGIYTTGGTIKNVIVNGSFRGIFTAGQTSDIYLENVGFANVCYTFNSDNGNKAYGVYAKGCTFSGWTSFSNVHKEVVFTDCTFNKGTGYTYEFCRPYAPTEFVGCEFEAGFEMDANATVTIEACTLAGEAITAENLATLVTSNIANVTIK